MFSLSRVVLTAVLWALVWASSGHARPVDETDRMPHFEMMDLNRRGDVPSPNSGVWATAAAGTTFFGGTFWAADSMRWEAIMDSCWTFDSGVGSHFISDSGYQPHVNPFKDPGLHGAMEGWVGIDNSYSEHPYFRRTEMLAQAPSCGTYSGSYALFAGVYAEEAAALCYVDSGPGYGDNWSICVENTSFAYDGSGDAVTWSYDYAADTEPGFDYTYAVVDTSGNDDDVIVATRTGVGFGPDSHELTPGVDMRSTAGPFHLKFCIVSDGAYSDQDGAYPTNCPLWVDEVEVVGGGVAYGPEGFELGVAGWSLSPPGPGVGGDWSNLRHLASLPPTNTTCSCTLADSVLLFSDVSLAPEGHGRFQDNLAASPWIDLREAGLVGSPGMFVQFDAYFELPLLNYVFQRQAIQFYPQTCSASGKLVTSPFISDGVVYFGGVFPGCKSPGSAPFQYNYGQIVGDGAEQIRIGMGVISYCRFFSNCSGMTNSTPWFDNVRLGVFGMPDASLIATSTIDQPQDIFPENGTLDIDAPGRLDSNNVKGQSTPEANTSLADTLIVNGGSGGAEVWVEFGVVPGPGVNGTALANWLAKHAPTQARGGIQFYHARMDTAEQGGHEANDTWMTAYHEEDPAFVGSDTDTDPNDIDPLGNQSRLLNDIFPDDLFTPGSRVNLFYKTRFVGNTSWFVIPGNGSIPGTDSAAVAGMFEWECLPSSMDADTTFNCVLYVDHFDGRGAQPFVEDALRTALPGGGNTYEGTAWDRYDVEAPSSQQASLGRPVGTEYGANASQLLGYDTIIWNSGNLHAFTLTQEDANVLIPWLAHEPGGTPAGHAFYGSGDGLAFSMTSEQISAPQATVFLNDYLGTSLVCETFRNETGGVGGGNPCGSVTVVDATACPDLLDAGGNLDTTGRTVTHQAQGSGCPQMRNYDVVTAVGATPHGASVNEEEYVGALKSANASVSSAATPSGGSGDFKTVLDGLSIHYRRDPSDCNYSQAPQTAARERMVEVLDWFGVPAGACTDPNQVNDVPVIDTPRFTTALLNFSPNPLLGGTGRIQFTLEREANATVRIFDVGGRLVKELFNGLGTEGINTVHWDGTDTAGRQVSSGVYFYRFTTAQETFARKIAVVRSGN